MELDLNELERMAEEVQGWSNVSDAWANPDDEDQGVQMPTWIVGTIGDDVHYDVAVADCEQYSVPGESEKLSKFYAAANPAVVLELVRRLREAERWRDAVIDQLDVMHITCARHKDDPAFAVHDCMAYSVNLALDPAVSEQAQALLDAGREAARAELDKQDPVFWYRPRMDDGYEGPLHDSQIEQVRRESGAWVPLIAKPIQPPRGEG